MIETTRIRKCDICGKTVKWFASAATNNTDAVRQVVISKRKHKSIREEKCDVCDSCSRRIVATINQIRCESEG